MLRTFLAFFALCLLAAPAWSSVFRWVDQDGNVHYSDKPPDMTVQSVKVKTTPTDPARLESDAEEQRAQEERRTSEQIETAEQQRVAAEEQKVRTTNCERARRNLDSIRNSQRMYVPLPDGERRYLSDEEIAESTAKAQADVSEWCDN